jgi:hypothetical protein
MTKHWITKIAVIGAAVMMMGMSVDANAGMGRGGMGGTSISNLTDDQISQLESEQKAFMESMQGLHQQFQEKNSSYRILDKTHIIG